MEWAFFLGIGTLVIVAVTGIVVVALMGDPFLHRTTTVAKSDPWLSDQQYLSGEIQKALRLYNQDNAQ